MSRFNHCVGLIVVSSVVLGVRASRAVEVVSPDGPAHYKPVLASVPPPQLVKGSDPDSVAVVQAQLVEFSAAIHGATVVNTPISTAGGSESVSASPSTPLTIETPAIFRRPRPPLNPVIPVVGTPITSCGLITLPGDYVVSQNLISSKGSCLVITRTSGVTLKCLSQGHGLGGYSISSTIKGASGIFAINSQNVSVSGCTSGAPTEDGSYGMLVYNGLNVSITGNQFENVGVYSSTSTVVKNNSILGSYYQTATSGTHFSSNKVQAYKDLASSNAIASWYGSNNQFTGNFIDGGWDGTSAGSTHSASSGIVLGYEQNDTIEYNTIQNTWIAGVDSVGSLSNTFIEYNQMTNVQDAGITSFFNTGWESNTIIGNYVKNAESLLHVVFNASSGYSEPSPATLYFENNKIMNNNFSSPIRIPGSTSYNYSLMVNLQPQPGTAVIPVVADQNEIANNLLPTNIDGPLLTPPSGFIDGGGNICGMPQAGSPIVCNP